jgi:hypothetical protein
MEYLLAEGAEEEQARSKVTIQFVDAFSNSNMENLSNFLTFRKH